MISSIMKKTFFSRLVIREFWLTSSSVKTNKEVTVSLVKSQEDTVILPCYEELVWKLSLSSLSLFRNNFDVSNFHLSTVSINHLTHHINVSIACIFSVYFLSWVFGNWLIYCCYFEKCLMYMFVVLVASSSLFQHLGGWIQININFLEIKLKIPPWNFLNI